LRGHIRQRGTGWQIALYAGKNERGKQHWYYETLESRPKAEARLAELISKRGVRSLARAKSQTVSTWIEKCLSDMSAGAIEQSTLASYKYAAKPLHAAFGSVKLQRLRQEQVQAAYNGWKAQGVAPQTIVHRHRLLRQCLEVAHRNGFVTDNVTARCRVPRVPMPEMHVPDAGKVAAAIIALRGTRFHAPAVLAAAAGLRRGEALRLRWNDLDTVSGQIAVSRAVSRSQTGMYDKEPKTARGRRSLRLPPWAVRELEAVKTGQEDRKAALRTAYHEHDLICCYEDGMPWHPGTFSGAFNAALRRAGVDAGFRALRHGHATELLRANIHPKVVSERLGHASVSITLDRYSHLIGGIQDTAVTALEELHCRSIVKPDNAGRRRAASNTRSKSRKRP
jgi:integrase